MKFGFSYAVVHSIKGIRQMARNEAGRNSMIKVCNDDACK